MTVPANAPDMGSDAPTAIIRDPAHHSEGPGPDVMDAASLEGDPVVSANGDHLGNIEAIMLDVGAGRVAYAVLSFGGFLGAGDKLFAIPWSAFTLDARNQRLVLDISRQRLESAPGFDRDHWPRMADREWASRIHEFYDEEPYWDDTLSASSG